MQLWKSNKSRLIRETKTVLVMIRMYCSYHHNSESGVCDDCRELAEYAEKRIEKCPYGYYKPTCANCTTHCYKPDMRSKIRMIMRFSGPRMLFRHPCLAIMHLLDGHREHRDRFVASVEKSY